MIDLACDAIGRKTRRRGTLLTALASISGFALSAGLAPAQAQEVPQGTDSVEAPQTQDIIVTGSRIRNSDVNSASPISVVDGAAIQASGSVNAAYFLNRMPEFGSQSTQEQGFANSSGLSTVELRNLGAVRTLVLVNGQRMTPSGGQVVNFNAIPSAMIERIDVLKDGASPIYGSDAIGGVVNVILRRKYDGLAVDAGLGISSRGDRDTQELSAMFGTSSDRASIVMGVSYSQQGVVKSIDRDFAHLSAAEGGQTIRSTPTVGRFYVSSGPSAGYYLGTASGGYTPVSSSDPSATLNVGELIYIVQPQSRFNITSLGEYDVTPQIRLFMEGMYTRATSTHQAALYPIGDAYVSDKWRTGLYVPALLSDGSVNPFNPFGTNMGLRVAPAQLGQRVFHNTSNTYQIRTGARGELWNRFDWTLGYAYGVSDSERSEDNAVNFTHAAQMLGIIPCTATEVAHGCVLTNFGGNNLTQAQIDYATFTAVDTSRYTQQYWYGSIDGPLFALPGGDLKFAAGFEYRKEAYKYNPDGLKLTGDYYGGTTYATDGGYRVAEGYLEFEAPLLRDVPFAHKLTLDAAVRVSSYSLAKVGDAVTWKVGGVYAPIEDITFRGHYGTGIRAPTVLELYNGGSSSVLGYVDPCDLTKGIAGATAVANCATVLNALGVNPTTFRQQLGGMTTTITGNTDLEAEKSQNLTAGVVLQPRWIPRLSLTVDYYNIKVTNAISSTSSFAQILINECYASANLSSDACSLFTPRQAASGGAFGAMTAKNINLGYIKTHGIDIGLNYALDAAKLGLLRSGTFTFETRAAYQPSYKVLQPTGTVSEFAGVWRTTTDSVAYPKWRGSASLGYSGKNWNFGWSTRFIKSTTRQGGNAAIYGIKLPDVYYHDITASYSWDNVTLGGGIRNLFDKQPPYALGDLYTNTVTNVYDFVGRYMYMRASVKF